VPVHAGDAFLARQILGTESSGLLPKEFSVVANSVPTSTGQIGNVTCDTHLYECGRHVWISGCIPGAEVTLSFNGDVRGHGQAPEGIARFPLSQKLLASAPVSICQSIPFVGKGPDIIITPDILPISGSLPAPLLPAELYECQSSVLVQSVFDGADVTVSLSNPNANPQTGGFDLPSLRFHLAKPLVKGQ
jgi:hypothetical protein